ncbi:MAG: SEC-C domain-containing protein [Pseudomonadota bacterium]
MNNQNPFSTIIANAKEAENNLIELLDRVDTEAALSIMMAQLLTATPEQNAVDQNGSHSAMIEILVKFCLPRFGANVGKIMSVQESADCGDLLSKILNGKIFSDDGMDSPNSIVRSLKMRSEVVRGSSHPEHSSKKIIQIQGRFDAWFKNKIGISPNRAIEIIFAIHRHLEDSLRRNVESFFDAGSEFAEKFSSVKKTKNKTAEEEYLVKYLRTKKTARQFGFLAKLNEVIPEIFPAMIENLPIRVLVSTQESNALKKLIGISQKSYKEDAKIQRHPLYVLNSGKVLLSNVSNCFDVLWDVFEEVAKSEPDFFDKKYRKHKSEWLEKEGKNLLSKIFPDDTIFSTLDYPNPDIEGGTAELDIAIKWGPFLLLTEAKAKQFRFESIRGDIGRLRTDIKNNVEDGYKQSMRAMRYIESVDEAVFTERSNGRVLKFKRNEVSSIYHFSLSLHHLNDVATELNKTKELGLFRDGNYPFSICLADLELILKSEITPDIFFHYIKKRVEILNAKEEWSGDELDLFSGYLDCRLNVNNIPNLGSDHNFTNLSFGGYSGDFDRMMYYERGDISTKPNISLSLPDEVRDIFDQLKTRDDNEARKIAFSLLDLDNKILFTIAKAIAELKNTTIEKDIFRICAFSDGNVAVSIVGSSSATIAELSTRTNLRSKIEKHRRKLNKSIGFGIICHQQGKNTAFDVTNYLESEWVPSAEMDQLIEREPSFVRVTKTNEIRRNDKCPCGSGKKFKKCHLS